MPRIKKIVCVLFAPSAASASDMSNTSGIKENDAIRIDAVLKGMKYGSSFSVAIEARNESNRYLEYEIDF